MADTDDGTSGARFQPSVPAPAAVFPLKGCGALDWGMQAGWPGSSGPPPAGR